MRIREQCRSEGVPFFFKQWGGVNKKTAGRVLDGRTWTSSRSYVGVLLMLELPEPSDDGLWYASAGDWYAHKHHFLRRYVDAFTTAMRKKQWAGLHYIDLFAGPGLVWLKDKGDSSGVHP